MFSSRPILPDAKNLSKDSNMRYKNLHNNTNTDCFKKLVDCIKNESVKNNNSVNISSYPRDTISQDMHDCYVYNLQYIKLMQRNGYIVEKGYYNDVDEYINISW